MCCSILVQLIHIIHHQSYIQCKWEILNKLVQLHHPMRHILHTHTHQNKHVSLLLLYFPKSIQFKSFSLKKIFDFISILYHTKKKFLFLFFHEKQKSNSNRKKESFKIIKQNSKTFNPTQDNETTSTSTTAFISTTTTSITSNNIICNIYIHNLKNVLFFHLMII